MKPSEIDKKNREAEKYIDNKEFYKASKLVLPIIAHDKLNNPKAFMLQLLAESKGDYQEVLKKCDLLIKTGKEQYFYYTVKGYVYYNLKEYDSVLLSCKKVIELNLNYVNIYNLKGSVYFYLKKYEKTLECYNKAIELDNTYMRVYYNKGYIYEYLKEYKKALEFYDKAIELNREFVDAYVGKGNIYYILKEYDIALEFYDKAIDLDKNYINAYNNKANIFNDLKEYDKALEYYNKAIDLDKKYVYAYNGKGNVYCNIKQYEKALECYNEVISLDKTFVNAYNGKGVVYEDLKDYELALTWYNKAIDLDENYALAYKNRGNTYSELEKHKNSISDYKKAIILNSEYKDELDYRISRAQTELEEQKKNEQNQKRSQISKVIEDIKAILEYDENVQVCHYTSIEVFKALCNGSKLRFSHSNLVNDPTEGRILYSFLNLPNIERKGESGFIGSFVESHNDDSLPLWRAYGRDGAGLSFCLELDILTESNKEIKIGEKTTEAFGDSSKTIRKLYKIAYIDDDRNILLDGKKREDLKVKLDELKKLLEPLINSDEIENEEALEPVVEIQYLFKNAIYKGEREVRYYELLKDDYPLIKWDNEQQPPTTYIEVENSILTSIRNVTVGPKAESGSSWVAWYKTMLARKGNKDVSVTQSKIPYR